MIKKMKGITGWLGAISFFTLAGTALAQTVQLTNPLSTTCSNSSNCFVTVLNNVIGFLFWDIAVPLSSIMVLVGAFQMITSAGDPEKFSTGRKTLLYAAIGLFVAIAAGGASNLLKSILGQ